MCVHLYEVIYSVALCIIDMAIHRDPDFTVMIVIWYAMYAVVFYHTHNRLQ